MAQRDIEAILKLKDELSSKIQKANKELKGINSHLKKSQKELGIIGKNTAFKNLTKSIITAQLATKAFVVAARGIGSAFRAASEFETSMTKLITLVGLSREEVESLEDQVKDLAGETARAPRELAESLFFIESAGLRGSTATEALKLSAQAAAVGMGEMKDIADALTSAMNAYGHDTLSAQQATDAMLAAVRAGKMEPRELAASIGQVLPIAAEMGVSFQEVNAALATLSKTGTDVTIGVTQIRSAMLAFLKPGEAAAKILAKYGLSAKMIREQIREKGLIETLISLREKFRGNEEELAKVVKRVEGFNAILALTGDHAGDTRDVLDQVNKSVGLTDEAFKEVSKTASHQFNQSLAELETIGIEIASNVLPPIVDLLKEFNSLLKEISPETKAWAVQMGLLAIALGKVVPWLIKLSKFSIVRGAAAAGGGPAAVIAGALIVATALEEKLKSLESVQERMSKRDKGIVGIIPPRQEQKNMIDFLKSVGGGVKEVGGAADGAAPPVKAFSTALSGDLGKALRDTSGWMKEAQSPMKEFSFDAWFAAENIKTMAAAAEDGVKAVQGIMILSSTNPLVKQFSTEILGASIGVRGAGKEVEKTGEEIDHFGRILQESANLTIIFGHAIGGLVGSLAGAASGFKSLFGKAKGGFGFGAFADLFKGADEKFSFSSILGGFANALPAIGAIAGPFIAGIKAIFSRPEYKKVMKDVGRDYGVAISEGLAKQIEQLEKTLNLGRFEASLLKLGDIMREAGGLNAGNLAEMAKGFDALLISVANGSIPAAEGLGAISDAFSEMAAGLEEMGIKGAVEMGKLINRMRELGLVTAEVQAFIEQKARSAVENLGKYFEYLAKQEELTGEQAQAALTQMAGAFQAAIQAAGSLVGAMQMLGPGFGELLAKLRETLGTENQLLNTMTEYYNFVTDNAEQLGAIEALGAAFKELLALGIINKENINDFGAAFKEEFAKMLAATGNETAALMAMGPQIGMLLEAYRELGLEVPPWLEEIAAKAKEAGASLEPPEGLPDILKDIRDILIEIGKAFGIAGDEAKEFGRKAGEAADQAGRTRGPGGGGGGGHDYMAQGGLHITQPLTKPTSILAHPGEVVDIDKPGRMPGAGGASFTMYNTFHIDGAADPNAVVEHVVANEDQSMKRIFQRAKQGGYV